MAHVADDVGVDPKFLENVLREAMNDPGLELREWRGSPGAALGGPAVALRLASTLRIKYNTAANKGIEVTHGSELVAALVRMGEATVRPFALETNRGGALVVLADSLRDVVGISLVPTST